MLLRVGSELFPRSDERGKDRLVLDRMIRELNLFLTGWVTYFRYAACKSHLAELDGWLRRKLRTLVTTLGVAIAVAALFSLVSFQRGYQSGMQGELDRLGAHVLVVPKNAVLPPGTKV